MQLNETYSGCSQGIIQCLDHRCNDGWYGEQCMDCKKLQGCKHGECEEVDGEEVVDGKKVKVKKPHTCHCDEGWTGPLCDEPICTEGCHKEHGGCEEVSKSVKSVWPLGSTIHFVKWEKKCEMLLKSRFSGCWEFLTHWIVVNCLLEQFQLVMLTAK